MTETERALLIAVTLRLIEGPVDAHSVEQSNLTLQDLAAAVEAEDAFRRRLSRRLP